MTDMTWDIEPAYGDLAWTDEVYDEDEYPFVVEESDFDVWGHPYIDLGTVDTWLGDDDLPGMCEKADFE